MYTFRKTERLCSQAVVDELYSSHSRLMEYPLSVHWKLYEGGKLAAPVQVLLVAPKRKLHHAVDRNRTKRLMRECYRLSKAPLVQLMEERGTCLALSFNYVHGSVPDHTWLSEHFTKALLAVEKALRTSNSKEKEGTAL